MGVASAGLGLVGSIMGMSAQEDQAQYNAELARNQGALKAETIRGQMPQIRAQSEFLRQQQDLAFGGQFHDLSQNIRKGTSDSISQFGASGFSVGGSQSKMAVLKSQLSQGEYAMGQLTKNAQLMEAKRQYNLASDLVNAENQARVAQYGGDAQAGSIMMSSQTQQTAGYFGLANSLLSMGAKTTGFSFG